MPASQSKRYLQHKLVTIIIILVTFMLALSNLATCRSLGNWHATAEQASSKTIGFIRELSYITHRDTIHGLLYTTDRNQGCFSLDEQHNTRKIGTKTTIKKIKIRGSWLGNSHSKLNVCSCYTNPMTESK